MGTGFSFDEDEFRGVLRDWRDLRADLARMRRSFDTLARAAARPPAEDLATRMFQLRAQAALEAAKASDQAVRTYVESFIARLERTAPGYTSTDDVSAAGFRRLVTGDPTPRAE